LTITPADKTKVYGDANPVLTGTITGIKNGDDITASYATAADQGSGVGGYAIVPTAVDGSLAKLANYEVTLKNGTLQVTKAPLTITAADKSKVYGDANPVLTGSITGIKNGDAISASYATSATNASGVGGYAIVPTAVDASPAKLANYDVTLVNGTLSITKAPLTVTAADKSKILGAANPVLTGVVTGVKNGDPIAATYTTTATATSPVGTYPISPSVSTTSPQVLANYNVTLVNGTLTVVFAWDGFLQPINDTAHQVGLYESKFKLGQTIPVKFDLKDAFGQVVQQTGSPTFTRSNNLGACDSSASLDTVPTVSPDGAAVYSFTGGHYQYNWSTKGITTAGEYRIFANLADGTSQSVYICLTK
jgi:hypothetical protein